MHGEIQLILIMCHLFAIQILDNLSAEQQPPSLHSQNASPCILYPNFWQKQPQYILGTSILHVKFCKFFQIGGIKLRYLEQVDHKREVVLVS